MIAIRRGSRSGTHGLTLVGALAVCLVVGLTGERLLYARAERDLGGAGGCSGLSRSPRPPPRRSSLSQSGGGRVLSDRRPRKSGPRRPSLDTVDGYQSIYPLRYHELFGLLIDPGLRLDPPRYDYYHLWGNRAYAFRPELDMDIADLLGVRWLYVRGEPLQDWA